VESPFRDFYTRLLNLYQKNAALYAGEFVKIKSTRDDKVYAYLRRSNDQKVLVILNLSNEPQQVTLDLQNAACDYAELFTEQKAGFAATVDLPLQPWEYRVYIQEEKPTRP
jgi:glycosidase